MDLPRLESLNKFQRQFPPIHGMIAAHFGMGEKPPVPPTVNDIQSIMAAYPKTN